MTRRGVLCAAVLAALLAIGAWPRLTGLSQWALTADEAYNCDWATRPSVVEALADQVPYDEHPPLFTLVLRLGIRLHLRHSPLQLRLVTLFAGLLCILSFYGLGRVVTGGRVGGLVLAGWATFSEAMIVQSQTLRHYSLALLFGSLTLISYFSPRRWREPAYLVCAVLAVESCYEMAFMVAVLGIAGLVTRARAWRARPDPPARARLISWCGFHAALAAVLLLQLWAPLHSPERPWRHPAYSDFMARSPGRLLGGVVNVISANHLGADSAAPWLLMIPFLIGLALLLRQRRVLLLALATGPLLLICVLSWRGYYPMFGQPRWTLWLAPTALFPLAVAFEALWRHGGGLRLGGMALAAVLLGGNAASSGALWHPDQLRRPEDFRSTRPAQAAGLALLARQLPPGERAQVSWGDHLRDVVARRLGWSEGLLPGDPIVTHHYELVDRPHLRRLGALSQHRSMWIFIRTDTPEETLRVEARLRGDPCWASLQVYGAGDHVLMQYDPTEVRARSNEPRCKIEN